MVLNVYKLRVQSLEEICLMFKVFWGWCLVTGGVGVTSYKGRGGFRCRLGYSKKS